MTDIPVSYIKQGSRNGLPAFQGFDSLVPTNLLAGAEPHLQPPTRILLASSIALAALTVVGLDANNHLVAATYNADPAVAIKPIGVLVHAATSLAANATIHGEVFLTGNYNAGSDDAGTDSPLVWDASFNTLAKKVGSVVGNPLLQFRHRRATGAPSA